MRGAAVPATGSGLVLVLIVVAFRSGDGAATGRLGRRFEQRFHVSHLSRPGRGSRSYVVATVCFLVMTCLCLFMIYGFNTWLPEIMRRAGHSAGSSLGFLLVFNIGAVVGTLIISLAADRFGSKPIITTTYLVSSVAVILLSLRLPTTVLYAAVALGGVGAMGTQSFVLAYVSKHYPVRMGATAMGWMLGFGRLGSMLAPPLLGLIIGAGLAFQWNFYALAVPGVIGALLVGLVPRAPEAAAAAGHGGVGGTARPLAGQT